MNIKIKKINSDDIKILQKISIETFTDTFGEQNSPENLINYLEKAFNSKKLFFSNFPNKSQYAQSKAERRKECNCKLSKKA